VTRAQELAQLVDAAVQLLPLSGDLALACPGFVAAVSEVDLVVEVATLGRNERLLGLEEGEFGAKTLNVDPVHAPYIGRRSDQDERNSAGC
jgi:hypothetical protein